MSNKTEGQVFGRMQIFTIAGPVILYGIMSSWGSRSDLLSFKTDGGDLMNPKMPAKLTGAASLAFQNPVYITSCASVVGKKKVRDL